MKKAKVLKSYHLKNSRGYIQLVKNGDIFLVGWNALRSVDNPNWGYPVHRFSTLKKAEEAFDKLVDLISQ